MTRKAPKIPNPSATPIALERRETTTDARLFSPSAARNRGPILDAISPALGEGARVLEIASGSGEHGAHICAARPDILWRPSDPDAASRASQAAHARAAGLTNLLAPLAIDAASEDWGLEGDEAAFDALVNINMIHISPWAAALGLIAGAGRHVKPGGLLFFYGPFKRGGRHTAPSNDAFDENLRLRDPSWGVRDISEVEVVASPLGFSLENIVEMPANNLSLIFRRTPAV